MDGVGPGFIVFQIGLSRFSPDQIGEWRRRQASGGRHIAPAGNRIKTFRRSRQIPIPEDIDPHGLGTLARFLIGDAGGKFLPPIDGHGSLVLPVLPLAMRFRNRFGIGLEPGFFGPRLADIGENIVHSFFDNFFHHHFKRRQLLAKVALAFSLATSLLAQFL